MASFSDRWNGGLLYAWARMVQKTCRFQISGKEHFQAYHDAGKPFIASHWHGLTMMTVNFFIQNLDPKDFGVLMPDDWRGGALKVFAEKMGAKPFPMNLEGDNTMGAGRQVINLVRWARAGKSLFFTPDGPHGPGYVTKPGVAFIAKKSGAAILPIGAYTRHGIIANRWDMYVGPYPFSRISIHVGKPIIVPPDAEDLAGYRETLTNEMHRAQAQAAANYYERPD